MEQPADGAELWTWPGAARTLGHYACSSWRKMQAFFVGCEELRERVYDRQMGSDEREITDVRTMGWLMTEPTLYADDVIRQFEADGDPPVER